MLDGGSWLVPSVGGKPFLRKPPLVNWLIAASMKISGVRNEWSARMPSALCVLALAGTIVAVSGGAGWMNVEASLTAAIFAMTQLGLLAKARFAGAEIEGIYAPISGIAIVLWQAWWAQRKSPWLTWTVPFVFLGLASLAKGPSLHLLFFYAIVIAALWSAREWRWLWHPAHFAGLAITAAIFAAWAVPFFQSPEAQEAAAVWKRQGIDRFTESDFNAGNFLLNIPRALGDQLPWLIFAPWLLAARLRSARMAGGFWKSLRGDRTNLGAVGVAVAGCFFAVLLIPGTLPRYVLPLGAPIALLLAAEFRWEDGKERLRWWWHQANRSVAALLFLASIAAPLVSFLAHNPLSDSSKFPQLAEAVRAALIVTLPIAVCAALFVRRFADAKTDLLAVFSGTLLGVASIFYAVAIVPNINRRDELRPMAAAIDAAIPVGQRLLIYEPGYLPAIFYLRAPYQYASGMGEVPPETPFVLTLEQSRKKFAERRPGMEVTQSFPQKDRQDVLLLRQRSSIPNDPRP